MLPGGAQVNPISARCALLKRCIAGCAERLAADCGHWHTMHSPPAEHLARGKCKHHVLNSRAGSCGRMELRHYIQQAGYAVYWDTTNYRRITVIQVIHQQVLYACICVLVDNHELRDFH